MGKINNIPEVKDKRQRRWEARTFMAMVAALSFDYKLSLRGLGRRIVFSLPGLPLPIRCPQARTEEEKNRKRAMRQQRRARILRRGWA